MSWSEKKKDVALEVAERIVKAPAMKSTKRQYKKLTKLYVGTLHQMNMVPSLVDSSGTRDRKNDTIAAALKLIMLRCGPKEDGYDELSVSAAGTSCK